MTPALLLVDDQRDILRLLHSALDTLGIPDLEIKEAGSSTAAFQAFNAGPVDLLVTDHNPPGLNGLELMRSVRGAHPDQRVILITGHVDRKLRDQMLAAGAMAIFSKPVPLGDFLAAVERGLGLAETILPEQPAAIPAVALKLSELFDSFLQQNQADAVFLITNRGRVVERAGDLRDRSMEVSLITAATGAFVAGLKVAESNHQEAPTQFAVFSAGDQDLILMPVDPLLALLVAGRNLAPRQTLAAMLETVSRLKEDVARSPREAAGDASTPRPRGAAPGARKPTQDLDAVLDAAREQGIKQEDLDAFWDAAASQQANKPTSSDVISYEQARKMGLTPDSDKE